MEKLLKFPTGKQQLLELEKLQRVVTAQKKIISVERKRNVTLATAIRHNKTLAVTSLVNKILVGSE